MAQWHLTDSTQFPIPTLIPVPMVKFWWLEAILDLVSIPLVGMVYPKVQMSAALTIEEPALNFVVALQGAAANTLRSIALWEAKKVATKRGQIDGTHMQRESLEASEPSLICREQLHRTVTQSQVRGNANQDVPEKVCAQTCLKDMKMMFLRLKVMVPSNRNISVPRKSSRRSRVMMNSDRDISHAALLAIIMKMIPKRDLLSFAKAVAHHITKFVWGREPAEIISSRKLTRETLSYSAAAASVLRMKNMMLLLI